MAWSRRRWSGIRSSRRRAGRCCCFRLRGAFNSVWAIAALCQPITAVTFATDGIHWGTGDYRYLRNAVGTATGLGTLAVYLLDEAGAQAFLQLWFVIAGWVVVRAVFGVVRIWPGVGAEPLSR